MRILVIGEPCIDVIHKADGRVYNEPGGISYAIVAGGILEDGIETFPVVGLSRADASYFENLFSQLDGVNMSGVYEVGAPTRRVDLFYEDDNHRWECSTAPIEPTPLEKIRPFLPAEGIHVNLISGHDVTLDTLRELRRSARDSRIHLDLHNIVMKHEPDGKRVRAPREDYLEWVKCADTVQLNEDEASVIDPEVSSHLQLAERVLDAGAKALVITLAEKGLSLFERTRGETKEHYLPAKGVNVVDPTGGGDVFGAAFLHALVLGRDYLVAALEGMQMASVKVSVAGPNKLVEIYRAGAHV